jgi:hypothetical protein
VTQFSIAVATGTWLLLDVDAQALTGWSTFALAVITFGLAVGTAVLAWYTYHLWATTKAMAQSASADANRQATLTREAITEAARSATAAERAIRQARRFDQRRLRAYVALETIRPYEYEPDWPVAAPCVLVFRNYGRTPANDVRIRVVTNVLPVATAEFEPIPDIDYQGSIGPRVRRNLSISALMIEPDRLDEIIRGTHELFLWGRADYVDAFGKSQFTEFRMIRQRGTQQFIHVPGGGRDS